jgi:hypothetical protein
VANQQWEKLLAVSVKKLFGSLNDLKKAILPRPGGMRSAVK